MNRKRYTEEFKTEAVKQVTERGYSVAEVAKRLGTTTHSLYAWLKRYGASLTKDGRFSPDHPSIYTIAERFLEHVWPDEDWSFLEDNPALPDYLLENAPEATSEKGQPTAALKLSQVVEPYTAFKVGNKPNLGQGSVDAYRDSINDLIFVIGDQPIGNVSFDDAQRFRDCMRQLPPNRNKAPTYTNRSCEELKALNLADKDTYSTSTISDKIKNQIFISFKIERQVLYSTIVF